MRTLESRLADYLESLVGKPPALAQIPSDRTAGLPLFLRERYRFFEVELFDHGWIFAMDSPDWDIGSPQEYAKHVGMLETALGGKRVILVLSAVPSWSRNRLIQAGLPFIVPGSQMFLPPFTVDLRERQPVAKKADARHLTPAAQAVLIFHLLRQPLNGLPLRDIAGLVGYTAMMITKVKDEWEAAGLCDAVRRGRSMVIEFAADRRRLWEQALPKLRSPVGKEHWILWQKPGPPAVTAGLTALSGRTMIADDPVPTYAMQDSAFRDSLERRLFVGCPDRNEANVLLQAWTYNPHLLADGPAADPLSLFLSLRHSPDERVQQQLARLLDQIVW